MKRETRKIINLSVTEVLRLVESGLAGFGLLLSKDKEERFEIYRFLENNAAERSQFLARVRYLKSRGFIRRFSEGKESFLEITEKGKKHLLSSDLRHISVKRPTKWDKKWRLVIFDIPEKNKVLRNLIRSKLYQVGFVQVQKSVFVYPFECTHEINLICDNYGGREYIKFLIADIIEGEEEILNKFLNVKTLNRSDIS